MGIYGREQYSVCADILNPVLIALLGKCMKGSTGRGGGRGGSGVRLHSARTASSSGLSARRLGSAAIGSGRAAAAARQRQSGSLPPVSRLDRRVFCCLSLPCAASRVSSTCVTRRRRLACRGSGRRQCVLKTVLCSVLKTVCDKCVSQCSAL